MYNELTINIIYSIIFIGLYVFYVAVLSSQKRIFVLFSIRSHELYTHDLENFSSFFVFFIFLFTFHSITKSHNVVVFISIPLTFLPNPGQRVTGRILIVPSPSVRSCGISTLFEALVLLSPRSRCIDVYERTSQEHIQTKELALMDYRFTQR